MDAILLGPQLTLEQAPIIVKQNLFIRLLYGALSKYML